MFRALILEGEFEFSLVIAIVIKEEVRGRLHERCKAKSPWNSRMFYNYSNFNNATNVTVN